MAIVGNIDKICGIIIGFAGGAFFVSLGCVVVMFVVSLGLTGDVVTGQIEASSLFICFNGGIDWVISTFFGD